jgi:DUF4097 and DUF4098 domain-containing protein YvlB
MKEQTKLIFILAIIITTVMALSSVTVAQNSADAYRVDEFSTTDSPLVDVATSGGFVEIIGTDENVVVSEMYVRQGRRYLSASDTDLSDFEITIEKDGDNVTIRAEQEGNRFFSMSRRPSISFKVYVPHNAIASGRTSGGYVAAYDLTNGIDLRTSGGSVTAENITGEISLRTSGGRISVENLSGDVDARTSGGSINANQVTGTAELRTSGGSIDLDNMAAKISARTSGGSISASLNTFNEDVDLRTSGGNIRIDIPEKENFDLELRGQRVNIELRNFSGEAERNNIRGYVGNGGPMLNARTSGGSVSVNYRRN